MRLRGGWLMLVLVGLSLAAEPMDIMVEDSTDFESHWKERSVDYETLCLKGCGAPVVMYCDMEKLKDTLKVRYAQWKSNGAFVKWNEDEDLPCETHMIFIIFAIVSILCHVFACVFFVLRMHAERNAYYVNY